MATSSPTYSHTRECSINASNGTHTTPKHGQQSSPSNQIMELPVSNDVDAS